MKNKENPKLKEKSTFEGEMFCSNKSKGSFLCVVSWVTLFAGEDRRGGKGGGANFGGPPSVLGGQVNR